MKFSCREALFGSTAFSSPFAGAYDDEEAAARAHDLAALKYWGPATILNFPVRSWSVFSKTRSSRVEL
jgi:hypothetical protein